jgi:aminoglycoside 3-N-acetyltransferase
MKFITAEEIRSALKAVGIVEGDIIILHSDISRIGLVQGCKKREENLAVYYSALCKSVGKEGTIAALACTESFARKRTFDYDNSPSEQGVLSEYIRTRAESLRSLHPLLSVCAVGKRASDICGNNSRSAFGWDSPFERLHRYKAKAVCIGVDLLAMTFVHHVEQFYGVPYGYTKEWDGKIIKGGQEIKKRFTAFVRYLDCGIEYDFSRLQERLFEKGFAQKSKLGYGNIYSVALDDVFSEGIEYLEEDIFFFLKNPPSKEVWRGQKIPSFDYE